MPEKLRHIADAPHHLGRKHDIIGIRHVLQTREQSAAGIGCELRQRLLLRIDPVETGADRLQQQVKGGGGISDPPIHAADMENALAFAQAPQHVEPVKGRDLATDLHTLHEIGIVQGFERGAGGKRGHRCSIRQRGLCQIAPRRLQKRCIILLVRFREGRDDVLLVDLIIGVAGRAPKLVGINRIGAVIGRAGEMLRNEIMAGIDAQARIAIFAIALGQPHRADRLPRHIVRDRRLGGNIPHDLLDERVAGLTAEVTCRDQPRPGDLILPAGECLAVEQMVVERAQCNAIRVQHDAAIGVQYLPAHHVRNAVQLTAQHVHHVAPVEPTQLM